MSTLLYVGTDNGVKTVRSDDGHSWVIDAPTVPSWSIEEIAIVASSPNIVLAGTRGDGVWRSDDFGKTFTKPSYGRRGPGKVRCLAIDPKNEHRVYAGCEPIDLYVSDDRGEHWEPIDALYEHPWVASVVYPVTGVEPHVRDFAIDPNDSNVMYAALQVGFILKTVDGGKSWQLLNNNFDADVHSFAIDPGDTNHIVIATGGENARRGTTKGLALYGSHDAGETWEPMAMNFTNDYSIPYALKPGEPKVAVTALAHGTPRYWRQRDGDCQAILVRTTDGGKSWEEIDLPEIEDAHRKMVVAIATDEANPDHFYGAFNDGQFILSTDAGITWSKMEVQLEGTNDIKCVTV